MAMFRRTSRNIKVAAILMFLTGVQAQHRVILSSQSLCSVTGSTVKIPCRFTTPDHSRVTQREWYRVQSSEREPQDLSKDPQYSGRVSVIIWGSTCELTVKKVRVRDSGVYNFRFKTQSSDWISDSSGVHLTVTDLQVKVDPNTVGQREVKMTCSSMCSLSTSLYYWYKNGQVNRYTNEASIVLDSTRPSNVGSYSCGVNESQRHSSLVCVLGKECWDVNYTTHHVCALKDTSIDLSCSYKHPAGHTVMKSVWFIKEQAEDVDVSEDEEYEGRVQSTQSSQNNWSLRITNLRERDARTYRFRFYTDGGDYTGEPGVTLSVTGLQVTVRSTTIDGETVTVSCITTCPLSNNPTYIWYKNGHRVSDCKSASCSVAAVSGAVSYSCAVEGHDSLLSPPVYSPKNTRAVILSSGDTVEGKSVTLSCSSDANPPVLTYSWFKQSTAADTLLTTDQNYSISNINSQHSGLYYCTAHNQLGHHNSTPTHLDVLYAPRNLSVTAVPSASGDLVTLLCTSDSNPNSTYSWYRKGDVNVIGNVTSITLSSRAWMEGFYYCTAGNGFGSSNSSEWSYTSGNSAVKYAVSGVTVAFILSFIAIFLWMRRRASASSIKSEEYNKSQSQSQSLSQNDSAPVYGNVSAMTSDPAQTGSSEDQDNDVQYSSVYFKHKQEVPLYSTVQPPMALSQEEEVEYAIVNLVKSGAVQ